MDAQNAFKKPELDISLAPVALTALDMLADEPELQRPELADVLKIINRVHKLAGRTCVGAEIPQDVFSGLEESRRLAADRETELGMGANIESLIQDTARKLRFISDFCRFQIRENDDCEAEGRHFALRPSTAFKREFPEWKGSQKLTRAQLDDMFGLSYRALAEVMGFPIIVDSNDREELERKIAEDLWRIYNGKNNLPGDNRTCKQGSLLPKFAEAGYDKIFYEKAFGGFTLAVKKIIIGAADSPLPQEDEKPMDGERLDELLRLSLELGKVPLACEAGVSAKKWRKETAAVRQALERDLKRTFDEWAIPCINKFGKQQHRFSHRHLLAKSKYFGYFGPKVYEIWCEKDKLETIASSTFKAAQVVMRHAIFGSKRDRLLHMRRIPRLVRIPQEDIQKFPQMGVAELRKYIRDRICGVLPKDISIDREHAVRILTAMAEHSVCVPVPAEYFSEGNKAIAVRELGYMGQTSAFLDTMPDFPLYMRQILMQQQRRATAVERLARVFGGAHIPPEYYVHELHSTKGGEHMGKRVGSLRRAARYERLIAKSRAEREAKAESLTDREGKQANAVRNLLAQYIQEDELPEADELREISYATIQHRISKRKARGEPITPDILDKDDGERVLRGIRERRRLENEDAKRELERLGYPYENLAVSRTKLMRPTRVLRKVRLLLSGLGEVPAGLLILSEETIAREIAERSVLKQNDSECEQEFADFCEERGIGEPPGYLNKFSRKVVWRRIRYVESRGVPFCGNRQWSWLNLSRKEMDRKIDVAWIQAHGRDQWAVLCGLYELDYDSLPVAARRCTAQHAWGYLRLLAAADLPPNAISLARVNDGSRLDWRNSIVDLIGDAPKTEKQEGFLRRHDCARSAEEDLGWKGDIDGMFDCVRDEELDEVADIISTGKGSQQLRKKLQARAELRESIIKRLTLARATLADIEYFIDNVGEEETAGRIEVFDKKNAPINVQELYRTKEGIEGLLQ